MIEFYERAVFKFEFLLHLSSTELVENVKETGELSLSRFSSQVNILPAMDEKLRNLAV